MCVCVFPHITLYYYWARNKLTHLPCTVRGAISDSDATDTGDIVSNLTEKEQSGLEGSRLAGGRLKAGYI